MLNLVLLRYSLRYTSTVYEARLDLLSPSLLIILFQIPWHLQLSLGYPQQPSGDRKRHGVKTDKTIISSHCQFD